METAEPRHDLGGVRSRAKSLSKRDVGAFWMPFTGTRNFKANLHLIVAAEGCDYFDPQERRVFDSLSGLRRASFGHRQEISQRCCTSWVTRRAFRSRIRRRSDTPIDAAA